MPIYSRTLVRKGGSLAITIPAKLAEKLGLQEGDQLAFIHKDGKNYAIVGNSSIFTVKDDDLKGLTDGALGLFGSEELSKEDIESMLKELAKEEEEI